MLSAATAWAAETSTAPDTRQTVIVVIGAPGEAPYGEDFIKAADAWAEACKRANANYLEIGRTSQTPVNAAATTHDATTTAGTIDRQRFQDALAAEAKGTSPLWIVLIGHGTYDGKEAKFNLRETDFSDSELAAWLKPLTRPIALIDCSSASAPFINRISGPNRVVITATRAGSEVSYSHFAVAMAGAIANPAADLDRDGQTSLLEAFLAASRSVADFYAGDGRLATEHALLDDNGDGLGTPADWFQGTRATRSARSGSAVDGIRAHQWFLLPSRDELALNPETRAKRNEIEQQIEALRQKKSSLPEKDYYAQLDALLVSLARVQIHAEPTP
jgi:hypothetical protein